jgi:hypothetical protein
MTPLGSWVIVLDQDEKFSIRFQHIIREYISRIDPELLEGGKRKYPLIVPLLHHNLINDIFHYAGAPVYHNQRCFYYDCGLKWDKRPYHCSLTYGHTRLVEQLPWVKGFSILHYARFDQKRIEARQRHLNDSKFGGYDKNSWKEETTDIRTLPETEY